MSNESFTVTATWLTVTEYLCHECGPETAYPSEALEFTLGFYGIRVAQSLIFYVVFYHYLLFCSLYFGDCFVCHSSNYGF